jgi:hypothetical protein
VAGTERTDPEATMQRLTIARTVIGFVAALAIEIVVPSRTTETAR